MADNRPALIAAIAAALGTPSLTDVAALRKRHRLRLRAYPKLDSAADLEALLAAIEAKAVVDPADHRIDHRTARIDADRDKAIYDAWMNDRSLSKAALGRSLSPPLSGERVGQLIRREERRRKNQERTEV